MKALSIKQPWAELIVSGKKSMEVRAWSTTYRGTLLIHTGTEPDYDPGVWKKLGDNSNGTEFGGIVGVGWLYDVIPLPWPKWQSLQRLHLNDDDRFREKLYGWFFSAIARLPFREISGMLGLFEVEPTPEEIRISGSVNCGVHCDLINPKVKLL